MLGLSVRNVAIVCVLPACAAGSYWLTTVSAWFWLVAAPLILILGIAFCVNLFLLRVVTCPHCSQLTTVIGRVDTHRCNSCKRQFTLPPT